VEINNNPIDLSNVPPATIPEKFKTTNQKMEQGRIW
jgi:hypothetical protein